MTMLCYLAGCDTTTISAFPTAAAAADKPIMSTTSTKLTNYDHHQNN